MKNITLLLLALIVISTKSSHAQNFNMANGGNISICSGTFYDSGGASNFYGPNQNFTYTICPDNSGAISVDFTSFLTESGADLLTIYDGNNILAPTLGTFSGANSPGFIEASSSNLSGCLTFVFVSNNSLQQPGWQATINCTIPCQDITANTSFSPAPDPDGIIRICQGTSVTMNGSGTYPQNNTNYAQSDATSTFSWSTQDGVNPVGQNVTHTFTNEGAYLVQLEIEDTEGCVNSVVHSQEIHVSTTPDFNGTVANPNLMCLGTQTSINGAALPVTFDQACVQPSFPPIALPDGLGISYETIADLTCFSNGQTLTNINDLLSICVNMEHSFMADLGIQIECPSGQTVSLKTFGVNGGGGTNLGLPLTGAAIGTGFDYCWAPTASNGTWGTNATFVSTLPAGTYESDASLSSLVGCDLNGIWKLTITDHLNGDNGYLFDWSINFDPAIIPPGITFTPTFVSESWQSNPSITSGGNPILVQPTVVGTDCFVYEVTDNFGCNYDTTVCINVLQDITLDPLTSVVQCNPYTLPAITGTNLSGNEAYFTGNNGSGTQYNPGDVISTTTSLRIYDRQSFAPFCGDQTGEFVITIITDSLIISCPPDLIANCNISEQPPYPDFASFQTAGGSSSIVPTSFTMLSEISDGNSCPETVQRTYQIVDDCGNVSSCVQTITINDTIAPTGTAPADLSLQCITDIPVPNIASITNATDNCTTNPTITWVNDFSDTSSCPKVIIRTYNIEDDCGNNIDVTQTITVNDDIAPTASNPVALSLQCIGDVPLPNISVVTDAADNCTTNPTVSFISDVSDGNICPEVITRTYRITDDCGNFTDVTQTITINDDILPTGTAPADLNIQCITNLPAADVNSITDEADNCTVNPIVTHVSDVSNGNTCPEIITRTYNIADDCGNNIDVVQTITINDDTNPTGTAPGNITVQCIEDVPPANINLITDEADNCTANPTVTFVSDASDGATCPETITRTYNIADDCGNNTNVIQIITVNDDIAPTASSPAPISVQCIEDVPTPDISAVTDEADNCTVSPIVTFIGDVSNGATCPEIITRTYRVTDDCGNFTDVNQTITINDDINPTGTAPADLTVQCIGDVPPADVNLITDEGDNCTANPTVTFVSDVSNGATCPEIITRTYNIADACGNDINVTQTITINDDILPTASNISTTVQCLTDVPAVDIAVITDEADNCTANPTIAFVSENSDGNSCNGEIITRVYSVTDDCGNSINVNHTILVDSYTPTFTVSGTGTTTCEGTDGMITISGLDPNTNYDMSYDGGTTNSITTNAAGEYVITGLPAGSYTNYTITDADCPSCTNTENVSININDPTAAYINAGPDQIVCEGTTITLNADNPEGANLSWDNGVTDGVGFVPPNGITYYTITAERVNCYSSDQLMVTVSPAITDITCPADLEAICDITEQPPYANFNAFIAVGGSATIPTGGIIDSTSFAFVSDVSDGLTCPETITRTYQIADTCGVIVTCTQNIVINDTIKPTGTAPAPVALQCITDLPAADVTLITDEADNCTANPTVTFVSDVSDGNTCPEIITRTYNIEDDCGNSIDVTQEFTINDDTNPTGTAPAPIAVQCIGDVPAPDVTLITDEADNCTTIPTVTFVSDVSDGNTCPEIITRTYNIADDCGNNIDLTQLITIDDDIPTTASDATPTTVQCNSDLPAVDIAVITDEADNCTVNPTVAFVSESSDGNLCNGEIITRIYSVTDDCGNSINVNHVITIDSYTPPTTVVASTTDPTTCGGTDGTITLSGFIPSTNYEISFDGGAPVPFTTDAAGEYIITGLTEGTYVDYTIIDDQCNVCTKTENVTITLTDPAPPIIGAGSDVEVCEDDIVTLTAFNPDGAAISWDNGVADGVGFVQPVGIMTYTVTGTSIQNCTSTDEVQVTVYPKPDVDFIANATEGCVGDEINITSLTPGIGNICNYTINGGPVINGCNINYTFNESECFDINLEVETINGCFDNLSKSNYICIDDYPIADFSVSPEELSTFYNEADFTNESTGAVAYDWDFGDESYSNDINPTHVYSVYDNDPKRIYDVQLIAYSNLGCPDTIIGALPYFEDLIYYVPNSFTPDGNKYNETFKPVFTSGFEPLDYKLEIFNRWGELIFESNDANYGWDGTYGAKKTNLVPEGTYVWKISFKKIRDEERMEEVGSVNLLR